MAKILNFQTKQQPKQQQNIIVLPHIFSKLLEMYKKYKNGIENRKIEFLRHQAYQYFYDELEEKIEPEEVDLPEFILRVKAEEKRQRLANQYADQSILHIIALNKVDECYTRRVKELKNLGIKAHF